MGSRIRRERHLEEQGARIQAGLDVREIALEELVVAALERRPRRDIGTVGARVRREREGDLPDRRERDAQGPLLSVVRQPVELPADARRARQRRRPVRWFLCDPVHARLGYRTQTPAQV
jgi:hypothetical protein